MTQWGPNGREVFERTYARPKPDGTIETWPETVRRVVDGNLALVDPKHIEPDEREKLVELIESFGAIPAGRHLWVTGVPGRQFNRNCHRAGWGPGLADHFTFLFEELMKGGGVGANYSDRYLAELPPVVGEVAVSFHCRPDHPDVHEFADQLMTEPWPAATLFDVEDTREGWVAAAGEILHLATIPGKHHVVFDVSPVRPRGAELRTFGGTASGPGPLITALGEIADVLDRVRQHNAYGRMTSLDAMEIDHAIASCVVAGNVRRSARMSIKSWRDPDVIDFIRCKQDTSKHWSTNISVEVDSEFWDALTMGDREAEYVWEAITDGMALNGEPGIFNSDLASVGERGDVACTNPCGEIALEEWESCNLGHVNLGAGHTLADLHEAFRLMTRFLIRATFADLTDARQAEVEARNRRIGVGVFGYHDWLIEQGVRYSEAPYSFEIQNSLQHWRFLVREEARRYSRQLGIPEPVKVTTVAPTGTVAKLPGVAEGIHPIYARYYERRIRYSANDLALLGFEAEGRSIEDCIYSAGTKVVVFHVEDALVAKYPEREHLIEQADEITLDAMLATQAMFQRNYADNAVSYTANFDPKRTTAVDIDKAIWDYRFDLKGTTVMPDGSRPQAPYTRITREQYLAATDHDIGQGFDECATGACPVR